MESISEKANSYKEDRSLHNSEALSERSFDK